MARKESGAKPPSRLQLIKEYRSGKLLGTLFGKHSRKWGLEHAIADAISDAHNAGDIDVLAIMSGGALRAIDQSTFFSGQALYGSIIPKLETSAEEMVRAVTALVAAGGDSGAAGLPINALAKWSERAPDRPRVLLDLVDAGSVEAAEFLMPILRTGMNAEPAYFLERAHAFSRSSHKPTALAAVRALGMYAPADDVEWNQLINTLTFAGNGDDPMIAAAIEAAMMRLKEGVGGHQAAIERLLTDILSAGPQDLALHQCADALWLHRNAISPSLRISMLNALVEFNPAHKTTLEHLDYALGDLFKSGDRDQVVDFLERLVRRHGRALKLRRFRSVCRAAHEGDRFGLNDWVVNWLLMGDIGLCEQMAKALFSVEVEGLILDIDFSRYALRPRDYPYIARKAVGFLFLKSATAASIVVSLIRSASPEVTTELEDLLFDPLLLNYSGVEKKFLAGIAKDRKDTAQKVVKRALARIETYRSDLQAASPIRELHPSEWQRQIEWQRNADAMAEAHKQADKKSIFGNLFAKVIVLHGTRTISYNRMGKEEPRRSESKMGSFSTSFEMPRIEVADPVGLQRTLLAFRGEARPA